ncbi:type II toxin-antitoxin system RelE/ParE family toxin [Nonomuraea rhodomycinica]|uniref:Type II toxin-antitoxin system RelE/ParE family toxin n=1 Tax=Nonomuraea rhodomycinica TaxID=1712872 RepID=A0A7Y6IXN3_9ACTN|nr:type II toxin-antitoxin system RelE/ParE family toxin [Nonomuraea rhodomycinica]NUW46225.1 type II toxin-antitoxin system RelE/ParE family toxin [Nonomuraea rhodomycinica]
MQDKPAAVWHFYRTPNGRPVVSEEIRDALGDGSPKKELGALLGRIQYNTALPRDTRSLGQGLYEARLTHTSNEYRLYFAYGPQGDHVLLALAFHMKGSRGAQDRVMDRARDRLADWLDRI